MPKAWLFGRSAALHGERPWQAHRPASTGALRARAGKKRGAANPLKVWDRTFPGESQHFFFGTIGDPPDPEVRLLHNAERNTNPRGVRNILGVRGPPERREGIFLFEKDLACPALWVQEPVG